jgi:hypothetical protein
VAPQHQRQQPQQPAEPFTPGDDAGDGPQDGPVAATAVAAVPVTGTASVAAASAPVSPSNPVVPAGTTDTADASDALAAPEGRVARDAGGETRAAERSAERAAAVAAAEGFHPLRLRPYVAEPGGDPEETTARPLLDVADGAPGTADLGLFPELYSGLEYPQDDPAGAGDPDDPTGAYAETAAARGRHRRRRRRIAVVAAAVAASALAAGTVAMTGQVMGDNEGTTGYALPDVSASVPDVTLPTDAGPAAATTAAPMTQESGASHGATATTTAPGSASAEAASVTTGPPASASPVGAPAAASTGSVPAGPAPGAPSAPPGAGPTASPAHGVLSSNPHVLQLGDTGTAVAGLQRQLTEVGVYHGPIDGVFDREVQLAVAAFQIWNWVSDEPDGSHDGVYGPHTRHVLDRQTSSH